MMYNDYHLHCSFCNEHRNNTEFPGPYTVVCRAHPQHYGQTNWLHKKGSGTMFNDVDQLIRRPFGHWRTPIRQDKQHPVQLRMC